MFGFDSEKVENLILKYPELAIALRAGVVSMKMVRELLDVDRYLMLDIYKELVKAGAVVGVSSSCFRASPMMMEYLKERDSNEKRENDSSK